MKFLIVSIFVLFSFNTYSQSKKIGLKIGIHPLHNPQKTVILFQPLIDFLNKKSKTFHLELALTSDYSVYNTKIKERAFDVISPNPYQSLKATKYSYKVISKWGNDELFKGILLVRTDSTIKTLQDIKNKTIAFPAPTALAATMMPKELLFRQKLAPEKDYKLHFVGNQESAILAVYNKTADVGSTWMPPWHLMQKEHPEITKKLKILAQTGSLPSNGILIKSEISEDVSLELQKLLHELKNTQEGKTILDNIGIPYFEKATVKTYLPVKMFIKQYEKTFGEIPW
jgi:phosphonate transport system substrate-binding protein